MSLSSFVFLATVLSSSFALPSDLNSRQTAAAPNPNAPLPGWTFVGCFTDAVPQQRTLQEHNIVNPGMTPALCTEFCGNFSTPLNFAGTEFTDECYCDFNIQGTAVKVNDTQCNFPCGGDSTIDCGGASLISVYQNSNTGVGPIPTNKAKVGNFVFSGCFKDVVGTSQRTLIQSIPIPGVTIERCTTACGASGFTMAGLEFGQECWCGNQFNPLAGNVTAALTDCSRACEADHTELCGAANRLSVYTVPPVVSSSSAAVPHSSSSTSVAPTVSASTVAISSISAAPTSTSVKTGTTVTATASTVVIPITSILSSPIPISSIVPKLP
ncbi:WSC domain-containing protein [Psilocybe cubensis]|uniref:WSC domain-containing protein n=2 Tax=Psilocybe cubensis TaxID=181762 RepID=A0ACB8HDT6_PSICU|nr:WSC domain-containing protein [Psilocybe cubensis]KAH9485994.1 WSC domain-containing protein [Psilocybe cubensis]